jgi:hypothetical protein
VGAWQDVRHPHHNWARPDALVGSGNCSGSSRDLHKTKCLKLILHEGADKLMWYVQFFIFPSLIVNFKRISSYAYAKLLCMNNTAACLVSLLVC